MVTAHYRSQDETYRQPVSQGQASLALAAGLTGLMASCPVW